jgi:hypothetical protein
MIRGGHIDPAACEWAAGSVDARNAVEITSVHAGHGLMNQMFTGVAGGCRRRNLRW